MDAQKRANTINEKTLRIEITKSNRMFFGKKTIVYDVKQPTLGVLEQVGAIVYNTKLDETVGAEILPSMLNRMQGDASMQIEVLACLLECKAHPSKAVKKLIRDNILPSEAFDLISKLFEFGDLNSFLNTTILMKGMGLMKSREIIAQQQKEGEQEGRKTFGEPLMGLAVDTGGHSAM